MYFCISFWPQYASIANLVAGAALRGWLPQLPSLRFIARELGGGPCLSAHR